MKPSKLFEALALIERDMGWSKALNDKEYLIQALKNIQLLMKVILQECKDEQQGS